MTNEQFDKLITTIKMVVEGEDTPRGLEGVAMALGGAGLKTSVAESISELASAVADLAEAVRETK